MLVVGSANVDGVTVPLAIDIRFTASVRTVVSTVPAALVSAVALIVADQPAPVPRASPTVHGVPGEAVMLVLVPVIAREPKVNGWVARYTSPDSPGTTSLARSVASVAVSARWYIRTSSTCPFRLLTYAAFHRSRPTLTAPVALHFAECVPVAFCVPLMYSVVVLLDASNTPTRCVHTPLVALPVVYAWSWIGELASASVIMKSQPLIPPPGSYLRMKALLVVPAWLATMYVEL